MNVVVAAPSLAFMAVRNPDTIAARLRYTAPFDMSGHPTITLPGGRTADGVPVGFQLVGHAFDEAGLLHTKIVTGGGRPKDPEFLASSLN